MKLQRQLSKKRGNKIYHKYVVVLSEDLIKEAGLKEGDELEPSVSKGEVRLRKK
ncbi:MAG: hypothetical protein AABW82_02315 [Nanoarchaeota archaeon]